jgi:hypothetical protein
MITNLLIFNSTTMFYDFFIDSFIFEFHKQNIHIDIIDNNITNNIELTIYNKNYPIIIFINPHYLKDKIIHNTIYEISKYFKYKILYLTEPIFFLIEKKVYEELICFIKPYCLWTYSQENFYKLNTKLNIFKISPCYNVKYNFIDICLENIQNRNIENIVFIGNISKNRECIQRDFQNSIFINNVWTLHDWKDMIHKNLFYINVHRRNNCLALEMFRIIPLLSNGCVIFSENCNEVEQNLLKDYNIIFCKKCDLYNTFIKYIQTINYELILEKTLLFRKNITYENTICNDLYKYIEFHETL